MIIEKSLRLRSQAAKRFARNALLLAVLVSTLIVLILPLICSGLPEALQEFKDSRQLTVAISEIVFRAAGLLVAIYVEIAARYELLADAMTLAGQSTQEFRELVAALEPKTVSFEQESSIKLSQLVTALRKEFKVPSTAEK